MLRSKCEMHAYLWCRIGRGLPIMHTRVDMVVPCFCIGSVHVASVTRHGPLSVMPSHFYIKYVLVSTCVA